MAFTLSPAAREAGHVVFVHDTIGSTSAEATRLAQAGETGPLWVVARRQTAGTGRRGSVWRTPAGNLAASLLLVSDESPARVATLGFVAGVALERALGDVAGPDGTDGGAPFGRAEFGRDRFALKWPNDVLGNGAKLAGILVGTETVGRGRRAVVIGIGVNVAAAPDGLPYRATSLADLGVSTTAETLFGRLTAAWVDAYRIWAGAGGFAGIRDLWLKRADGLGGVVAVRSADGIMRGTFETIDDHGQLVVRAQDGSARTVSAGDVHFGVAASASAEARA